MQSIEHCTALVSTLFPGGGQLQYRLIPGDHYNAVLSTNATAAASSTNDSAHTDGAASVPMGAVCSIDIIVPKLRAAAWAVSDEVGFDGESALQIDELAVLIEKDFSCISPRSGEEEIDTFPNPNAAIN